MKSISRVVLVLSLVGVLVNSQQANNDFSMGNLTENSVLLRSEHIFVNGTPNGYVTRVMDYNTGTWAVIRKTEALDQNVNGTGARVTGWGIGDRTSWLHFESFLGGDINFLVNVYGEIAEPNHYELGELSELSILAHSLQLRVPANATEIIIGNAEFFGRNISRIEAFDRNTNGTGASLFYIFGGVNFDFAELSFISTNFNESIEFDINFYVDFERDLIIGSEYGATVFLEAQSVNATSNGSDIASTSVHFQMEQARLIGMVQALSLNGQRGQINITEGGLYQNNITMNFTSQVAGSDVDYMVAVYSADSDDVNDFRLGLFHPGDSLIHTERLTVQAEMGQYVIGNVTIQTDRIITMFQGFDLDGNGGNLGSVGGGIGGRSVTLIFFSQYNQMIDFNIEVYGRILP